MNTARFLMSVWPFYNIMHDRVKIAIFKILRYKNIVLGGCKWFLATAPILILFIRIILSSTAGFGNLNNLKGGPYYIL